MKFKSSIFLLILVFLCAAFGHADAENKKRKNDLKKAKELLHYEEYANAIPHIQELLNEDSQNAYYNFWMGKCLYLTYKKNQALSFFQIVESVNPEVDKEFHYYYALTLHYNLQFDRAIDEYRHDLERYDAESAEFKDINNRISQCLYAKKVADAPVNQMVKVSNLGQQINSEFSEHSPVISADNSTLVYTARRPDSRGADPKTGFYDEDIYVSKNNGENWSAAQNIGLPVNSKGHDATISLTADGKTLYIYRHKKSGGLYRTDFDDAAKVWKEPQLVQKPLNSKHYEASICQSADGSKIFFTSDRPGGFGGLDIYMATKSTKNDWSEPLNLGQRINTSFNEDAPYFHPDGRTLFFSSNGPNSIGGYDIYVAEFDSATTSFSVPINMGAPLNTPDDEIYFVLSADGQHGYFASGKEGGSGEKDIYEIRFPYSPKPARQYMIEVAGIVQDANTLDTLPSKVRLIDHLLGIAVDSMEIGTQVGSYSFALEPQRSYSVEVTTDGYDVVKEDFTTPELLGEDVSLQRNLFVKRNKLIAAPVENPALQHLYFDFDKADLRQVSKKELDMVADFLLKNSNLSVEILGHTDWYGNYDYNVALSQRRSHSASSYLHEIGVPANRVVQKWFSENEPLESNDDDRGRQFNRRCELRLVDNTGKIAFASVRLRTGSEGPYVDHTKPKGLPGFDNPGTKPSAAAPVEGNFESTAVASSDNNSAMFASVVGTSNADLGAFDLQNIYFDFDKTQLRSASTNELDELSALLKQHSDYTLTIKGHTDDFGSVDYNQSLSETRCAMAFEYLNRAGVPVSQMSFSGFSESIPIGTNDNESGRQSNRRVEFELKQGAKVIYRSHP
jgi:outer membrane protein OmpA-like peptidoglycan-associated protein/Tol biopolymer transport system component